MSPPDTNLSKQTRRHRPALYGMVVAIAAVGALLVFAVNNAPDDTEIAPAPENGTSTTSE
ncbi:MULTISPECIES: hypothetical protein [unclassified Roseovarius]|uniref:hypothetical protein n=1 Tax=unclassified Roseovarius TaxID=2614913 RepID=UPI00273D7861|nr:MULTISPECIES: hypothetical protein [unclassified Roseovarius]